LEIESPRSDTDRLASSRQQTIQITGPKQQRFSCGCRLFIYCARGKQTDRKPAPAWGVLERG
jgi:hypothetical protein